MSFEYWFVRVFEYYLIFCSICMYLLGSFTCYVSSWWRHDLSWLAICFNWVVWPSRCFSWQTEDQGRELEIYQVKASWKANLYLSILKKSPMFALVFVQKAFIYLCMIYIYIINQLNPDFFHQRYETTCFNLIPSQFEGSQNIRTLIGSCQMSFCIWQYHQQTSFRIHILNKWQSVWRLARLWFWRTNSTSSTWKMLPETT